LKRFCNAVVDNGGQSESALTQQEQHPRYASFLLRLWQVKDKGTWVWRASLERPGSTRVHGFSDPESLFAFLRTFLGLDESEKPSSSLSDRG